MPTLAVLQSDPVARARLRRALSGIHDLVEVSGWPALRETVLSHAVEGCIVDPYTPFGPPRLRDLFDLRRHEPPTALVVYADFTGREEDLFRLGREGIDGVIPAGVGDGGHAIRETVRHALGVSAAARVRRSLDGRYDPTATAALGWAIANADRSPRVEDLADGLRTTPATLTRTLRRLGLPTPRRLLLWGRVFRATHMLRSTGRTVERVAFILGYQSGSSLARAFRRTTGLPPVETLRKGGVTRLLRTFLEERGARTGRVQRLRPATGRPGGLP